MHMPRMICLATLIAATTTAFAAAPAQQPPAPTQPAVKPPAAVVTGAPKPTIPVYVGRDPDQIADSDTVITQIIPIQYVAAADLRDMLTTVTHPDNPIVASGNTLVITEASSVVKRMVQIVCYVDVNPSGGNVIAIVPLVAGSAPEAAREINATFNPPKSP